MGALFLKIVNMSFVTSWLILAVMLLRLLLKKAPKWIACVLWALVAIRLICPFSPESGWSLIGNREPLTQEVVDTIVPAIGFERTENRAQNPGEDTTQGLGSTQVAVSHTLDGTKVAAMVWICGVTVLLLSAVVSYTHLRRKVGPSLHMRDNIWLCDEIAAPFLLGFWKPQIYIPSGTEESKLSPVIAHENAHLKRRDYWWKPLGFLVLAIYWFNPLVWIAYILLCRDIELACDEKVIHDLERRKVLSILRRCSPAA